ncbi:lysine -specific demethylase 4c-like protein [Fusarium austroafricanum]|uniref:Lysine -specific demethylase 4c-like protein n=1 Tax=Fusarium austroafricanum TaxID=2364996 RepID=A0A8H4KHU1_9HYPO|nr:lysine -specific demethylase 4c-like protein [Fusarium austroafricanum]
MVSAPDGQLDHHAQKHQALEQRYKDLEKELVSDYDIIVEKLSDLRDTANGRAPESTFVYKPSAPNINQSTSRKRPSQDVDMKIKTLIVESRENQRKVVKKLSELGQDLADQGKSLDDWVLARHMVSRMVSSRDVQPHGHPATGVNAAAGAESSLSTPMVSPTPPPWSPLNNPDSPQQQGHEQPVDFLPEVDGNQDSPAPDFQDEEEEPLGQNDLVLREPTISVAVDELGVFLPQTIQRLIQNEDFDYVANIEDNRNTLAVPWEELQAKDCKGDFHFFQISDGPEDGEPFDDQPLSYIGNPIDGRYDSLLDAGEQINNDPDAAEVFGSLEWHVGTRRTCVPLASSTLESWSCHIVLAGWMLWIVIDKNDNHKLHEFLNRRCLVPPARYVSDDAIGAPQNSSVGKASTELRCDNWVNHLDALLSPKQLSDEGIGFKIRCVGPGQMTVFRQKEYRLSLDISCALAISRSFLLPVEPLWPRASTLCEWCLRLSPPIPGNKRIVYLKPGEDSSETQEKTDKARKRDTERPKAKSSSCEKGTRTTRTRLTTGLDIIVQDFKKVDPKCKFPDYETQKPVAAVLCLASIIWSRPALEQFATLVRAWRMRNQGFTVMGNDEVPGAGRESCVRLLHYIEEARRGAELGQLQVRLGELRLAQIIAKHHEEDARQRTSSGFLKEIYKEVNWSKYEYYKHCNNGKKWLALCQGLDDGKKVFRPGLLCFIMLGVDHEFRELYNDDAKKGGIDHTKKDQIESFARLLDDPYTNMISEAGEAFLEALRGGQQSGTVRFAFEDRDEAVDWRVIGGSEIENFLARV